MVGPHENESTGARLFADLRPVQWLTEIDSDQLRPLLVSAGGGEQTAGEAMVCAHTLSRLLDYVCCAVVFMGAKNEELARSHQQVNESQ
jgi:hypothetical protein